MRFALIFTKLQLWNARFRSFGFICAEKTELRVAAGAQIVITDIDQDLGRAVADEIVDTCLFFEPGRGLRR